MGGFLRKLQVAVCIGLLAGIVACSSSGNEAESPVSAPVLNDLKVLVTFGGGSAMTPGFAADTLEYSLSVQSDISTVGIIASSDPAAKYEIQINKKKAYSGIMEKVELAIGDNGINVAVSDDRHDPRVYVVHVNRENIQPVVDKFLELSFVDPSTGITMGYRLFVPDGYDPSKPCPLVLFLHGAGEMGSDNEIQLVANQGATVWAKPELQARHPCFVLAPQCPMDPSAEPARFRYGKKGWTSLIPLGFADPYKPLPELETAFDILKSVSGKYRIDGDRIYCTGLSMGGFGTWAMAVAHPETFAALVVIAGGGDPDALATVAQIPSWIFHAVKDPMVSVSFSDNTVKALTKAGGKPRYTTYAEDAYLYPSAHLSWVPAYASAEMREWLFQQHGNTRSARTPSLPRPFPPT
ncbi:MAG: cadherin-like beta sandwich domain-containing protein [Spirochaetia bacterium]|jgi:predicted peptidase